MSGKTHQPNLCPGPGDGRRCGSGRPSTPRGGRCEDCTRVAMRLWHKKRHHRTPELVGREKPKKRPKPGKSMHARRKAQEVAAARAVKPDSSAMGFRAALKAVDDAIKALG